MPVSSGSSRSLPLARRITPSGSQRGSAQVTSRVAMMRYAVAAVVLAVLAPVLAAGSAQAATAYRYWGYYQYAKGAWQYAQTGPDGTKPADGAVEGWRFAVSDGSVPRLPRVTPDFAATCGAQSAPAGKKRVLVVVDAGRPADSPDGTTAEVPVVQKCAVVDTAATGAQVLAAVAAVRVGNAMTCGIDGYPATGCSDAVGTLTAAMKAPDTAPLPAATTTTPEATSASSGTSPGTPAATGTTAPAENPAASTNNITPAILGIVALLVMAAVALTLVRRNRTTGPGDPDA